MNLWFTSDWHVGHANIIEYSGRPFRDVAHMNEELIERHNAVVQPNDTVIDVGDFALNEKFVEPTVKRLNGRRILVCGNHDRCFRSHKHAEYYRKKYVEWGFAEVLQAYDIDIGSTSVHVEHMPYVGDHTDKVRYAEYRAKDDGRWLIHGHVHEAWQQRGRQINVGVDVRGYRPVHVDEIVAIIARGPVDANRPSA